MSAHRRKAGVGSISFLESILREGTSAFEHARFCFYNLTIKMIYDLATELLFSGMPLISTLSGQVYESKVKQSEYKEIFQKLKAVK